MKEILNYYENEKKAFEGYEVPEKLKQTASLIMFRFNIEGICDGMYLCNVMAHQSGSGDGCGSFTSDYVNTDIAADAISGAYKTNISSSEREELSYMIEHNALSKQVIQNMESSLDRWKNMLRQNHDEWRTSYLEKNISIYEEKMEWLKNQMENSDQLELLAVAKTPNACFRFWGKFIFESRKDADGEFCYPEFYNLELEKKSEEGFYEPYTPGYIRWNGTKVEIEDMLNTAVNSFLFERNEISTLFLHNELRAWAKPFQDNVALTVNGKKIPKKIFTNDLYNYMDLLLVTDKFIYYGYDSEILMFGTEEHELCSDNYFAEVGLTESYENIAIQTETCLFGAPEEKTFQKRVIEKIKSTEEVDEDEFHYSYLPSGYYLEYKPEYPDESKKDFVVHQDLNGSITVDRLNEDGEIVLKHYENIDDFEKRFSIL